jgi:hypothetical protein
MQNRGVKHIKNCNNANCTFCKGEEVIEIDLEPSQMT